MTFETAGDSLKGLRKKKDSILSTSALGILLVTPKLSNGWVMLDFFPSTSIDEICRVAVLWWGTKVDSRKSSRKHFLKQTFLNGVKTPTSIHLSLLSWKLKMSLAIRNKARTISRDQELQRSVLAICTTERIRSSSNRELVSHQEFWIPSWVGGKVVCVAVTHQQPIIQGAKEIVTLQGGMRNALKLAFPELSFVKWGEESFMYHNLFWIVCSLAHILFSAIPQPIYRDLLSSCTQQHFPGRLQMRNSKRAIAPAICALCPLSVAGAQVLSSCWARTYSAFPRPKRRSKIENF